MQNYNEFIKARKLLNTNQNWLKYVYYYVLKDMVNQTGMPPEGLNNTFMSPEVLKSVREEYQNEVEEQEELSLEDGEDGELSIQQQVELDSECIKQALHVGLRGFLVAGHQDVFTDDMHSQEEDYVDDDYLYSHELINDSLSTEYVEYIKSHRLFLDNLSWLKYLIDVAFGDVIKNAGPMPDPTDEESLEQLNPIIEETLLWYHGTRYASNNDVNNWNADLNFDWYYTTPFLELVELDIEEAA